MQTNTYSEPSTETEFDSESQFGGQPETEDVRQKVQETASTLVDQAQQVATAQTATQKERAAQALDSVAKSLYEGGTSLRETQPQIATIADQAASRVVDASAYLREHDLADLVSEAERFARREPLIFLGAAFALGFAAARFMKASAPRSESSYEPRSGTSRSARALGPGNSSYEYSAGASIGNRGFGFGDEGNASGGQYGSEPNDRS
jgi:hypothetical protein